MRAILVGLLVLVSLDAAAARNPAAAKKHKQAEEQLIAGETEAALKLVEEGLVLAPADKDLLLLRGHVLLRQGEYEPAAKAYRDFLAAGARGRQKRDVERILADLDQVASTFVVVVVANGPAEVRLDTRTGKPFCTASPQCKKGVIPGDHLIVVDRPGYTRIARRVVVERGATETLELTLVEKPSPLAVKVTPPTAVVTVDGQPLGKDLAAGDHEIVVTHPGYLRQSRVVRAAGGEPISVEITLGVGLPTEISPPGATVVVDGGEVALVDGMLPVGDGAREVVVRAPGHHPQTVKLPADRIAVTLRPIGAYLTVDGATEGELFVDGDKRADLPQPTTLELPPGRHTIEVRRPGRPPLRRTADLVAERQAILFLQAERGPPIKAWISAGVTVAAMTTGVFLGRAALDKRKEYDVNATEAGVTRTDEMQTALEDDGRRQALLADISFGVAAVAMVASIYWFRTEGRKAAGRIELRPMPGGLGLSGSF